MGLWKWTIDSHGSCERMIPLLIPVSHDSLSLLFLFGHAVTKFLADIGIAFPILTQRYRDTQNPVTFSRHMFILNTAAPSSRRTFLFVERACISFAVTSICLRRGKLQPSVLVSRPAATRLRHTKDRMSRRRRSTSHSRSDKPRPHRSILALRPHSHHRQRHAACQCRHRHA